MPYIPPSTIQILHGQGLGSNTLNAADNPTVCKRRVVGSGATSGRHDHQRRPRGPLDHLEIGRRHRPTRV